MLSIYFHTHTLHTTGLRRHRRKGRREVHGTKLLEGQCTPLLFTKVSLYVFKLLAAVGCASILVGMFYCSGAVGEVAVRVSWSLLF